MCVTLPSLTSGDFGQGGEGTGQMPFARYQPGPSFAGGNLAVAACSDANSEADEQSCSYRTQSSLHTPGSATLYEPDQAGQTGSFPYPEMSLVNYQSNSLVKQISENVPSVPEFWRKIDKGR